MRHPLCALLTVLLATTGAFAGELPIVKPAVVGMSAAKLKEVDRALESLVDQGKLIGVTVVVARHGRIAYFRTFGLMDREAGKPMQRDTIHRIYSMTKAITSAAALVLVDEGKLKLDDPVSKFVPAMADVVVYGEDGNRAPARPVQVRDLFLHTSGFGYGRGGVGAVDERYPTLQLRERAFALDEFSNRLARIPLYFDPGTDWHYGVSLDVLGRVIEVASGQPFDTFLEERVFRPLDMQDTGFHVPDEKLGRFAANYQTRKDGSLKLLDAPAESIYRKPPKFQSGGGGLVSTARDYLRFLQAIQNGGELDGTRILSRESVELMTTNQLPEDVGWIHFGDDVREGVGFGLGFSVKTKPSDWDQDAVVGEYGWGGAASTHYWCSPKDDLIVVTLEQTMPYAWVTERAVKGLIYDAVERDTAE